MASSTSDRGVPPESSGGDTAFQNALRLRRHGDFVRADAWCVEALQADSRHFNAYHLRGLIALDNGDCDRGVEMIERSLDINLRQPLAWSNLGNAHLERGRWQRALDCINRALELKPDLMIAHYNRGNALKELRRFEEALGSYDDALRFDAVYVKTLNNRGLVLMELGRTQDALTSFKRATEVDPRFAPAFRNLAAAYLQSGRSSDALTVSDALSALSPREPGALCLRGNILLSLRRLDDAFACYSEALLVKSDHVDALIGRGAVLQRQHKLEEALEECDRVLTIDPAHDLARCNRGNVLLGLDRSEAALEAYQRVLNRTPQDCVALHGRAAALRKLGRLDEADRGFAALLRIDENHVSALGNLFHLRMERCDWNDYEGLSEKLLNSLKRSLSFANPLSLLMFDDPTMNLNCARAFVAATYPQNDALGALRRSNVPRSGRKIRIAYVSADFGDHPVAHLLVGTLEMHDRSAFEIVGMSLKAPGNTPFDRRLQSSFDRFVDASGTSDRDIAALMRDYGVDVAVDLMGFTEGSRLGIFAYRAAPVQVSYLGYAGTTGAPYIDYLLADPMVVPTDREMDYGERVVRLPHCYLPTDRRRRASASPTRFEAGLPGSGFVFCAFTQAHKLNPPVFDVWLRLLKQADGSVLWLRDMGSVVTANLMAAAEAVGVDGARLIFAPRVANPAEHLGRLALADLYLDTFPYNAHSTSCDALAAGVPVLTCAGKGFASRVAASALMAVDLPELVAFDLEEYERRALDMVLQPARLRSLRFRLTQAADKVPLFDTARYVRDLEAAFRLMHTGAMADSASFP